jgi:hypothetical protein
VGHTTASSVMHRPRERIRTQRMSLQFIPLVSWLTLLIICSGDPISLNLGLFEQLLSMPLGPNGIDSSVMTAFRVARVKQSVATNGHYFAGPLITLALNPATYLFTYRFFANHTAENPEGYLDAKTLMSFQGVTGAKGNFKWASGQERIPENVSDYLDTVLLPSLTLTTVVPSCHRRRLFNPNLHCRSRWHRIGISRIASIWWQHRTAKLVHWCRCRRLDRQRLQRAETS